MSKCVAFVCDWRKFQNKPGRFTQMRGVPHAFRTNVTVEGEICSSHIKPSQSELSQDTKHLLRTWTNNIRGGNHSRIKPRLYALENRVAKLSPWQNSSNFYRLEGWRPQFLVAQLFASSGGLESSYQIKEALICEFFSSELTETLL